MDGGTATVEEMIKSTKRGLLVSFFWYIRPVDPMTLLNTGMTRDGLFLIENGEIVGAGAELPLERVAGGGLQQHLDARAARADAHRRGLRQPGHGAGSGDEARGLHHDLDLAGGVRQP